MGQSLRVFAAGHAWSSFGKYVSARDTGHAYGRTCTADAVVLPGTDHLNNYSKGKKKAGRQLTGLPFSFEYAAYSSVFRLNTSFANSLAWLLWSRAFSINF